MGRVLSKSKTIIELEEKINKGNSEALHEFWDKLKDKGTPIIENIEGDSENALVTFVFKADEEVENIVFMPPVGRMNFLENKMERLLKTNLWHASYKIKNDIRFSYFFSVNDSLDANSTERWDKLIYDQFNRNKLIYKGNNGEWDKIDSYAIMPKAGEHFWVKERSDTLKGSLHEYEFQSKNFKEGRRVRIYIPNDYKKHDKPYKFLTLTDGDEYINILSAVQVLDNLISDKKIPPIVAIFIDSTETRREELRCSDIFGDIVVKELIPWVREKYNISNKAEDAIIGGFSLGGLSAAYLGLKHSEVFGNILSQSGSYWYMPEGYEGTETDCWLSTEFKSIDKLPLKFYLNVGVLEHEERMIGTNIKLKDVLISKGYTVNFEYFNSGHDCLSWGETLANGLISLIG